MTPGRLGSQLTRTSAAVVAAAVVGGLGTDVRSPWYRRLDKPTWQPPGAAFGPVWTVLYGLMAVAAARSMDRLEEPVGRHAFARAFGVNLVLNAGWNWLFFRARRPRLALAELVLLEVSTVDLTRRAASTDAPAGAMLVPYAAWVAFAGALNAAIARRNPGR